MGFSGLLLYNICIPLLYKKKKKIREDFVTLKYFICLQV